MTNLNSTISALRDIARDAIRMRLINARRTIINSLTVRKDGIVADIAAVKLDIATAEYEKAHVPTDHPRKDEKVKGYDATITRCNETLNMLNDSLTSIDKDIAEQDGGIVKLESGETKVSREELEAETARLVKVVADKAAAEVKPAAPAPAVSKKA